MTNFKIWLAVKLIYLAAKLFPFPYNIIFMDHIAMFNFFLKQMLEEVEESDNVVEFKGRLH